MFPHGETIEVVRRTLGYDDNGDPIIDPDPAGTIIEGVAIAPRTGGPGTSSTEIQGRGRAGVVEGFTIYAPAGSVIPHDAQVRWRGVLYDVDGEAGEWANPYTGRRAGIEVAIRRAEG